MKAITFSCLAFFLAVVIPAHALTGNEYQRLSNNERTLWLVGVADGLSTAKLLSSGVQPPLAKCLGELEWQQIRAIFEKNLNQNPENWNFPAAFSFNQTFNKHCNIK